MGDLSEADAAAAATPKSEVNGQHGHTPELQATIEGEATQQQRQQPAKKKQKRNKPTLSCTECVERKTKVRVLITTHCTTSYLTKHQPTCIYSHLSRQSLCSILVAWALGPTAKACTHFSAVQSLLTQVFQCDRNRPVCWACLKRQSSCHYSEIANIIAAAA